MRPLNRCDITGKHALDVTPCISVGPKIMQGGPDHAVANQQISRVASVRSNAAKPLGKGQRGRILAAVPMISPQSTKCPQLSVRVTEFLCNLQGVRPSCAGFRYRTFGIDQRRSECRVQLHFVARASRRSRPEVGERAFDAHATLVQ